MLFSNAIFYSESEHMSRCFKHLVLFPGVLGQSTESEEGYDMRFETIQSDGVILAFKYFHEGFL